VRKLVIWVVVALVASGAARAQTSASYRLSEFAIQEGGHPDSGQILQSAGLRMTLDAVGDSVPLLALAAPSYVMDAGFAIRYPPPGEVHDLRALDKTAFSWLGEGSAGTYDLYRGRVSVLPSSFGSCSAADLSGPFGSAPDVPDLDAGELAYFYLVTVRNRLREEGTMGRTSAGATRANASPCP